MIFNSDKYIKVNPDNNVLWIGDLTTEEHTHFIKQQYKVFDPNTGYTALKKDIAEDYSAFIFMDGVEVFVKIYQCIPKSVELDSVCLIYDYYNIFKSDSETFWEAKATIRKERIRNILKNIEQ
jgi:hypothetical protein